MFDVTILFSKMINHSCPDTIDERAFNKKPSTVYSKHENLTLALVGENFISFKHRNISHKKFKVFSQTNHRYLEYLPYFIWYSQESGWILPEIKWINFDHFCLASNYELL